MKKKSDIIKFLFVTGLSLLSMFLLWKKQNGPDVLPILLQMKPAFLFAGIASFFFYLLMESLAFRYLLRLKGYRMSISRGIGYSLVDAFFSNISPGGSAGQPGQFYYMHRDGISSGDCMMSLIAFNSMYHVAMLLLVLLGVFTGMLSWVSSIMGMRIILWFGIICQVIFVIFQCSVMFSKKILPAFVLKLFGMFHKHPRLKHWAAKEERVKENIRQYKEFGEYLRQNPKIFLVILIYVTAMLFFINVISYFLYRALGFSKLSFLELLSLQAIIRIAVESLPLPGGVGVSEGSLLAIYSYFMPGSMAFGWMVGTRLLTFFTGLLLGGGIVLWMPKIGYRRFPSKFQKKIAVNNKKPISFSM